MDKVHKKTNKLFDEIYKKKIKLTKNVNKDSVKLSNDDIADLPYKCCIYCQKVFFNSKFLMKHLLRRHSDELVLFYRNFNNHDCNYNSNDLQHLIEILQKEFLSLKKELCSTKLTVEERHETNYFGKNQVTEEELRNTPTVKRNRNSSDDVVSNEIKDLKEKMFDVEKDVQNLNDKFLELDNVLKNDVLKKQDVNEKLVLSEERIMRAQESQFIELRQVLLNELKSVLQNQQEDINDEWKSQLLELRHEIKRLDYAINNIKQITCIDSLKEEIKKELVPHLIPHIRSSKKCRKRKPHHALTKSELFFNKSKCQQKEMSQAENFCCKKSHSESLDKNSPTSLKTVDELSSIVADKLLEFSIAPNTSKLSSAEYNKISKIINFEKEQLQKKYSNFYEIYDKVNKIANQRAHSKLKNKKQNKIRFSEPLTSSRISLNHSVALFEDGGIPEQSSSVQNLNDHCFKNHLSSNSKHVSGEKVCQVNEGANFTCPDKGASGDSVHPFSRKEKNPVKNISTRKIKTSSPIEGIVSSNDQTTSFLMDSITIVTEQQNYKTHSISPVNQKRFNSAANNHSLQFKEKAAFSLDKSNINDPSLLVIDKQIMPLKHTKSNYAKEFENSVSVKNSKNSKDLNAMFSKDRSFISSRQVNYENQRKSNSAIQSHSVQFEKSPIFKPETLDKLTELDECYKSDDDFDDVSSLETYKSSDDDKDQTANCS